MNPRALALPLSVHSLFFLKRRKQVKQTHWKVNWRVGVGLRGVSKAQLPPSSKMVNVHDTVVVKSARNPRASSTVTLTLICNVCQTALTTFLCSFLFYYKTHTPIIQHQKKKKKASRLHKHVMQIKRHTCDMTMLLCRVHMTEDEVIKNIDVNSHLKFLFLIYLSLSKVS